MNDDQKNDVRAGRGVIVLGYFIVLGLAIREYLLLEIYETFEREIQGWGMTIFLTPLFMIYAAPTWILLPKIRFAHARKRLHRRILFACAFPVILFLITLIIQVSAEEPVWGNVGAAVALSSFICLPVFYVAWKRRREIAF